MEWPHQKGLFVVGLKMSMKNFLRNLEKSVDENGMVW